MHLGSTRGWLWAGTFSLPDSYLIGIRLQYCLAHLIPDSLLCEIKRTNEVVVLYGCNKGEAVSITSRLILPLRDCGARIQR